ncbi:hypothetical protein BH09PSE6_BH09PSE6_20980 [soil metagenome]
MNAKRTLAVSAATFAALALMVGFDMTRRFDDAVMLALHSLAGGTAFERGMAVLTWAGSAWWVLPAAALMSLSRSRQGAQALVPLGLVLAAVALSNLVKDIVARDRPALWPLLVTETSASFPSSHSMQSAALAWAGWIVFAGGSNRRRLAAVLLAYVALIGLSRMVLGVHYPSDVLGGWLLATATAMAFRIMLDRRA